jgi:hypothetical protein
MWSRPAITSRAAERHASVAVGVQRHAGVTLGGQAGGNCRSLFSMVATRCAPALPELAIATGTMVATRCAPAPPELAIATSGNLDFSSCVYSGKDLAGTADD